MVSFYLEQFPSLLALARWIAAKLYVQSKLPFRVSDVFYWGSEDAPTNEIDHKVFVVFFLWRDVQFACRVIFALTEQC